MRKPSQNAGWGMCVATAVSVLCGACLTVDNVPLVESPEDDSGSIGPDAAIDGGATIDGGDAIDAGDAAMLPAREPCDRFHNAWNAPTDCEVARLNVRYDRTATSEAYLLGISDDGRFVSVSTSGLNAPGVDGPNPGFVVDLEDGSAAPLPLANYTFVGSALIGGPKPLLLFTGLSSAALVEDDTNGKPDLYVADIIAGSYERISVGAEDRQSPAGFDSASGFAVTSDARFVAFTAAGLPLGTAAPFDQQYGIYVRDRTLQATEFASVLPDGVATVTNTQAVAFSQDGRFLAFTDITNKGTALYVRDRAFATTELIVASASAIVGHDVSDDGRFVLFETARDSIVDNDTNNVADCFMYDRVEQRSIRLTERADGLEGNGACNYARFTEDESAVLLRSRATNLVTARISTEQGMWRYYVRDMQSGGIREVGFKLEGKIRPLDGEQTLVAPNLKVAAFVTEERLLPEDTGSYEERDVYMARLSFYP